MPSHGQCHSISRHAWAQLCTRSGTALQLFAPHNSDSCIKCKAGASLHELHECRQLCCPQQQCTAARQSCNSLVKYWWSSGPDTVFTMQAKPPSRSPDFRPTHSFMFPSKCHNRVTHTWRDVSGVIANSPTLCDSDTSSDIVHVLMSNLPLDSIQYGCWSHVTTFLNQVHFKIKIK